MTDLSSSGMNSRVFWWVAAAVIAVALTVVTVTSVLSGRGEADKFSECLSHKSAQFCR